MKSIKPENRANPERRRRFLILCFVLMSSCFLPNWFTWRVPLQVLLLLTILTMGIWVFFKRRFESRFEFLMFVAILIAALSEILEFKALYYLSGVVAVIGLIGWDSRRPTREEPNDTASVKGP